MGCHCGNTDGSAVRCRFGNHIDTDIAARTRFVFNDYGTQRVLDPLGQHAGRHIDWPTRAIGHHNTDHFARHNGLGLHGNHREHRKHHQK